MPATKKAAKKSSGWGGARPNSGPKAPPKKLVSARIELPAYEALEERAKKSGRALSAEAAEILEAVLCPKDN